MIKIEYSPTFADFKHAVKLDRRMNWLHLAFHLGATWLAPGIALFLILFVAILACFFPLQFASGSAVTFGALAICLLAPLIEQWIMRRSYQSMFPAKTPVRIIRYTVSENGVEVEIPSIAEATYQWGSFLRFIQDGQFILLYTSKTRFISLPTSSLSLENHNELNGLIARHLPTGQR